MSMYFLRCFEQYTLRYCVSAGFGSSLMHDSFCLLQLTSAHFPFVMFLCFICCLQYWNLFFLFMCGSKKSLVACSAFAS